MFNKPKKVITPEEIVHEFLDSGIDPVEMERLQVDIVMKYLGPASDVDWELTPRYANEVMNQWHFVIQMLRQITDYHQQLEQSEISTKTN